MQFCVDFQTHNQSNVTGLYFNSSGNFSLNLLYTHFATGLKCFFVFFNHLT